MSGDSRPNVISVCSYQAHCLGKDIEECEHMRATVVMFCYLFCESVICDVNHEEMQFHILLLQWETFNGEIRILKDISRRSIKAQDLVRYWV